MFWLWRRSQVASEHTNSPSSSYLASRLTRPAGHDLGQLRPLAVGLLLLGGADIDEAGHALVGGEPEAGAYGLAVGIPLRDPAGGKAQGIGGQTHIEAGGSA